MFPLASASTLLLIWSLVILLKPSISAHSSSDQLPPLPGNDQPSNSAIRYPPPQNKHQSAGDTDHLDSSVPITQVLSSPRSIDELQFTKLDNLTQPSRHWKPESSQKNTLYPYQHERNQYHFSRPLPLAPIYPINTNLVTQALQPTPTLEDLVSPQQTELPLIQSTHKRRSLNRRDQPENWPGTDTVYATKTVFISQAGPPTIVYVSNGQIINPAQPTSCTMNCNNVQNTWASPSRNPNVVVATVTAYSSAEKFARDGFQSNSFFKIFVFANLVHLFMIFGFGLVHFGL